MNDKHLTALEQQVVRRYVGGQPAREVGADLGLSTSEVYRILSFAGVSRRSRGRAGRPRGHLTELEREVVRRYASGLSAREVGASLDLSMDQVYRVLRVAGARRRPPGSPGKRSLRELVIHLYVEERLALEEVAARFGLTRERVSQMLKTRGVVPRRGSASLLEELQTQFNHEIVRLYVEEGLPLDKVGARFGLTRGRVRQILRTCGVSPRRGSCRLLEEQQTQRNQEIIRLYVEEGLSLKKIGERLGLSDFAVRHVVGRVGRGTGGLL